jgi:hypothetical protein
MITSKKTKALDLKEGDLVYCKGEFGIVLKEGRTLFHDHRFVKIMWIRDYNSKYKIVYFFEDNKIVEKIIAKSKTQGATPLFNKDLTATPTPKEFPSKIPSPNPDIKRNKENENK